MTSIHFKCSKSFFCAIFVSISTLVWNQFDFFLYLFFNREKQQLHNNNGNSNENKKMPFEMSWVTHTKGEQHKSLRMIYSQAYQYSLKK